MEGKLVSVRFILLLTGYVLLQLVASDTVRLLLSFFLSFFFLETGGLTFVSVRTYIPKFHFVSQIANQSSVVESAASKNGDPKGTILA